MEDILIPPSAFLRHKKQNNVDFDSFLENSNKSINYNGKFQRNNKESQTEWIKKINKCSETTERILTEDDFNLKVKAKENKYINEIDVIKRQCKEDVFKLTKETEELNKRLVEAVKEKESVKDELSKLKIYIGNVENREVWMEERERLIEELDRSHFNISDQQSIIDSLKIQLSSMEKIQAIQERELSKDISVTHSYSEISKGGHHYNSLLKAWRQKVLSLLVQQESEEIIADKERHRCQQQIGDMVNEIEHLQSSLEQFHLRIDVQNAQLSTGEILVEKYKRENDNLLIQLEVITREQQEDSRLIENVFDQLNSFQKLVEEDFSVKFNQACSKIDGFQRRLDYATSRFPMIQANLKRHKNMSKGSEFDSRRFEEDLSENNPEKVSQLKEALVITSKELKLVRQERDRLIVMLEKDSATFHDRLNEKREELKEEMEQLKSTVVKYESSFSKLTKDLELLKQENYRLKADYDILLSSNHTETENLKISLKESRAELSKLSHEYSNWKRSSSKETQQIEEQLRKSEEQLIQCDNHWKKICDQLAAERDLLKMTIRQEGLISKFKIRDKGQRSSTDKPSTKQGLEMENIMKEVSELAGELNFDS